MPHGHVCVQCGACVVCNVCDVCCVERVMCPAPHECVQANAVIWRSHALKRGTNYEWQNRFMHTAIRKCVNALSDPAACSSMLDACTASCCTASNWKNSCREHLEHTCSYTALNSGRNPDECSCTGRSTEHLQNIAALSTCNTSAANSTASRHRFTMAAIIQS